MVQPGSVVTGSFPDLCVPDVVASTRFYRELLGLDPLVDHGWYVELGRDGVVLLALVRAGHPTVPAVAGAPARGLLVSFEVDDLAIPVAAATAIGCKFIVEPVTELGQLHFMVADPDGTVVDVIERTALDRSDLASLAAYRRADRAASAS